MQEKNKERIDWIDSLKGIAIIAVVMHHTWLMVMRPGEHTIFWKFAISFQMPLFMFLSGYVFTPPQFRKLLIKLVSFAMPILTVGVVYTLFLNRTLGELAYNDFKQGYWYLYVLGIFYSLMTLLSVERMIGKQWHIVFEISFGIFVYATFLYLQGSVPEPYNGMLSLSRCVDNFPYFFLGFVSCKYGLIEKTIAQYEYLFPIAILWWVLSVLGIVGFKLPYNIPSIIVCSCAIITFVYLASVSFNGQCNHSKSGRLFSWFGRNSLDIYIYHYFFVRSIHLEGFGAWIVNTNNYLIELFVVFAMSLIIALLTIAVGKIVRGNAITRDFVYGQFIHKLIKS